MAKSKKRSVKKGSAQAAAYAERQNAKKRAWTHNVYEYTLQETLDAASLALNEHFGFGPDRLKRFATAFEEIFSEIQRLSHEDKDDDDREYSRQKVEEAMKRAWGPYYEPREVRYNLNYVLDESGHAVVDRA